MRLGAVSVVHTGRGRFRGGRHAPAAPHVGYAEIMQLTVGLRTALQRAYRIDFGRELGDEDAQALGSALLDLIGNALVRRATIHRSLKEPVDESVHKRDAADVSTSL